MLLYVVDIILFVLLGLGINSVVLFLLLLDMLCFFAFDGFGCGFD